MIDIIDEFRDSRAKEILSKVSPYIKKGDRILDVGSGDCTVARGLKRDGYEVTLLDVVDKGIYKGLRPIIYDGKNIPFDDNSFDVALLITVLHHTKEPIKVLEEVARVAPRIVVTEDIYKGLFQKYITFVMDSVLNGEFWGHPHMNMTEKEWEREFDGLGLKIIDKSIHNFWKFFTSGTFYLERDRA